MSTNIEKELEIHKAKRNYAIKILLEVNDEIIKYSAGPEMDIFVTKAIIEGIINKKIREIYGGERFIVEVEV